MTIEEAQDALHHDTPCEFYSTGAGWVAWLDTGWHPVKVQEVDAEQQRVTVQAGNVTVEVRGVEDIENKLRLMPIETYADHLDAALELSPMVTKELQPRWRKEGTN